MSGLICHSYFHLSQPFLLLLFLNNAQTGIAFPAQWIPSHPLKHSACLSFNIQSDIFFIGESNTCIPNITDISPNLLNCTPSTNDCSFSSLSLSSHPPPLVSDSHFLSTFPPLADQSSQLPGYSATRLQPASLASPAAARLRTPERQ